MWPLWFEWRSMVRALQPVRFRDFFAELPQDRPCCVPCLARIASVPEDTVRRELQAIARRVETRQARCYGCEQSATTYRLVA